MTSEDGFTDTNPILATESTFTSNNNDTIVNNLNGKYYGVASLIGTPVDSNIDNNTINNNNNNNNNKVLLQS
jgi:hypothetical protein